MPDHTPQSAPARPDYAAILNVRRSSGPLNPRLVPGADPDLDPDLDDAEGGPGALRPRRRRAPRLATDGLAEVAAGAVRLESARRGFVQQDLAMALGMSRSAVSARYTGQVAWTLDEIGRIALLYGCRVVDLLTEAPNARGRTTW